MKKSNLITQDGLELPCVILPVERSLFPVGKEVLVYCQNRLVRGYIQDDSDYVAEIEIVVDFAIIPELDEFIKENTESNIELITELYYVLGNLKLENNSFQNIF